MYNFSSKEDLVQFLSSEVLTTSEARDLMGCSRQYLSQLVGEKKLIPIKVLSRESLFLKEDVEAFKNRKSTQCKK